MTRQPTVPRRLSAISLVVVALLLLASAVQASGGAVETVDYRVQSGDSLWSIAVDQTTSQGDVRAMVHSIQVINDLDGSTIYSGQILELPSG